MEHAKLPIFAERFHELREERAQAEFAEFLGISRPTVGFYENGSRLPDALTLRKIAEKCNVSADWLLGLTDYPNRETLETTVDDIGFSFRSTSEMLMAKKSYPETIHGLDKLCSDGIFLALCAKFFELSQRIRLLYLKTEKTDADEIPLSSNDESDLSIYDYCDYRFQRFIKTFSEYLDEVSGSKKLRDLLSEKRRTKYDKLIEQARKKRGEAD